jgi:hypothetical protein
MLPFSYFDPYFAKDQLVLFLRYDLSFSEENIILARESSDAFIFQRVVHASQ